MQKQYRDRTLDESSKLKESIMTSKAKSTDTNEKSGGFMSFLETSYKTGMGAAEGLQQAGMEVPLVMLEAVGVPKEKTDALRNSNQKLVHGMVSGIEGIASKFVEAGSAQVGLVAGAIQESRAPKEAPKAKKES
jgi:hypothetical protein